MIKESIDEWIGMNGVHKLVIVFLIMISLIPGCLALDGEEPGIEHDPSLPPVRIGKHLVARDIQSLRIFDLRSFFPRFETPEAHSSPAFDPRESGELQIKLLRNPGLFIQDIPDISTIGELRNLKTLEIQGMKDPVDTRFVARLENLETLSFYCSPLKQLEIRNLKKLKYLILSYTELQNLQGLPDQLKLLVVTDGIPESEIEEYRQRNPKVNVVPTKPDDCQNLAS